MIARVCISKATQMSLISSQAGIGVSTSDKMAAGDVTQHNHSLSSSSSEMHEVENSRAAVSLRGVTVDRKD